MIVKKSVMALLTGALLLIVVSAAGQSTKTIKEKKIATVTVHEYFVEDGMDDPLVESIEVKLWEKYVYDDKGKLVEEVFLDSKGRVTRTVKSIYADGLKIEKQFYNSKDMLYKRKVYEYEYRK